MLVKKHVTAIDFIRNLDMYDSGADIYKDKIDKLRKSTAYLLESGMKHDISPLDISRHWFINQNIDRSKAGDLDKKIDISMYYIALGFKVKYRHGINLAYQLQKSDLLYICSDYESVINPIAATIAKTLLVQVVQQLEEIPKDIIDILHDYMVDIGTNDSNIFEAILFLQGLKYELDCINRSSSNDLSDRHLDYLEDIVETPF